MVRTIHERVTVEAGGVLRLHSKEFPPPGTEAEIVLTYDDHLAGHATGTGSSKLFGAWKGIFGSSEEVDEWLRNERDAWDR